MRAGLRTQPSRRKCRNMELMNFHNILRTHFRLARSLRRRWHALAAFLLLTVALLPPGRPAYAQEPAAPPSPTPQLTISDAPGGAVIQWTTGGAADLAAVNRVLSPRDFQGYSLPIQAIPFRVTGGDGAGTLQIRQLQTADLPPGAVQPNPVDAEPLVVDANTVLQPPPQTPQLPTAPAFILSSGKVGSEWIVVVGFSPVFADNGSVRLATALDAVVVGAVRAPDDAALEAQMGAESAAAAAAQDAATAAPEPVVDPALAAQVESPDIPDAASAPVKLLVSAPGIQRVLRSGLTAAWASVDLRNVRLTFNGAVVPVQSTASEIRFYAAKAGDRWNTASAYLLWIESDPAKRSPQIATRAASAPAAAADAAELEASSTVLDRGIWLDNKLYDSMYPGDDADHYFAAKLVRPIATFTIQQYTADLTDVGRIRPANKLPLAKGRQTYGLTLVRVEAETYSPSFPLRVTVTGGSAAAQAKQATVDFSNVTSKKVTFAFDGTDARNLTLALLPPQPDTPRALLIDSIAYERPVTLNLGGRGAVFAGVAGQKTYRWAGASTVLGAIGLWDVTNPNVPVAITGAVAGGFVDSQAARSYIVAGDGFVQTAGVTAWRPISVSSVPASHAIYVIPNASFAPALQPLVNLRQTQNCTTTAKCVVSVVDVTRIYDGYGFGNISPEAIRLFLRAFFVRLLPAGSPRLMSVVMVGDGTWDPKNYEAKQINPTLMPPYMREHVDSQYGEAPCDRCYGQYLGFNGLCADPHTCDDKDGNATTFSPEVWVGRFPVKSVAELQSFVAKLFGYETATDTNALWRSRVLYIADNYMKGDGPKPVPDNAGDFAAILDRIRALNPLAGSPFNAPRVYYDPFPGAQTPPKYGQPWRYSDPKVAWSRVIASLNDGESIAVYYGHATPWTMARYDLPTAWRFALIENTDADYLFNNKRFFMQLSMTCLTSQFARPADSGMTLDEAFLLRTNGGSIAVWGPAGYGIPYAHDRLLAGYFKKLFAAKGAPTTIGALTDAGYLELSFNALGHYDMLRTFSIMGDPLTRIRVPLTALYPAYLPVTKRH